MNKAITIFQLTNSWAVLWMEGPEAKRKTELTFDEAVELARKLQEK